MMKGLRLLTALCALLALGTAATACAPVEALLSSSGGSSQTDPNGIFTPLNLAIRDGNVEEVKKLLEQGASPNEDADYGSGAESIPVGNLSLAVNFNKEPLEMVQLLLEAGADPQKDPFALDDAIEKGELEVVSLLLQHGADPNQGLQAAVMYDQMEIAALLLQNGADPNQGVTLARTTYNARMLELLEEAGATVEQLPREQTHPEDYTRSEDGSLIRLH
ncbi:ankyrin repeat domain-containing protein [Paenibacillus macerans]|uniref:ankyrin repeat domain-containing protein n=1 Tax=Paenibacillus macerans TaxID=44252 RepID=UPI00203FF062|nr:ankyrin repeat domain-containing protein [Paenibacillus macerans]MCM3703303.1 ankyrin repeat domain-containing protein [Paenibacillus macerans]